MVQALLAQHPSCPLCSTIASAGGKGGDQQGPGRQELEPVTLQPGLSKIISAQSRGGPGWPQHLLHGPDKPENAKAKCWKV